MRRLTLCTPSWSPDQIRTTIRLILVLMIWPIASMDFSMLPNIGAGHHNWAHPFEWQNNFADHLYATLFGSKQAVSFTLSTALITGAVAIARPSRPLVLLATIPIFLSETVLYRYRVQYYDIDFPLALLMLSGLLPVNWQDSVVKRSTIKEVGSTIVGLAMLAYLSLTYFLAGLSKLNYDGRWWENVDLGALRGG